MQVKCRECGHKKEKREAYLVEKISEKTLKITNTYYCNETCYKKQEDRKILVQECNDMIEELLDIPIRCNMYFNKLYSPIIESYGYPVIKKFLKEENNTIELALDGKDFKTGNVKIKYFMAIMQNNIEKYKHINNKPTVERISLEVLDDDFIIKSPVKERKRSIEDILNEL